LKTHKKNLVYKEIKGSYCEYGDFWIDPIKPVKRALITHAHFDHMSFGCDEYICSPETSTILKERLGHKIKIKSYGYDEIFNINGIKISFHPSGHILGSSQIKLEAGNEKWLITGDFKRQKDETCLKYQEIKTDFLICESTFALPIFKWASTNKIVNQIVDWVNISPNMTSILFCYSLGKAQRLLKELENKEIKKIYVHTNIKKINDIYIKEGIKLKDIPIIDGKIKPKDYQGSLLLMPPSQNKSNLLKRFGDYQTAFASGWMLIRALKNRSGYDNGFAISDHADWNGLINTIKSSQAKKVFLDHGNGESLAKYLSIKENIEIHPFKIN
tara:strand:- start:1428 stop:2414 length:987 start_codon:yes stop_codon:yes gene_type:complete